MLLLALAATCVTMTAQTDLHINKVFEIYGHSKGCKMVEMHDTRLKGYNIRIYKSLIYKKNAPAVETYLKEDRRRAKKIREVMDNGRIASGYYMMPPNNDGTNRYILFSNTDNGGGAVIYIEGWLSPDDIMKICYSTSKSERD